MEVSLGFFYTVVVACVDFVNLVRFLFLAVAPVTTVDAVAIIVVVAVNGIDVVHFIVAIVVVVAIIIVVIGVVIVVAFEKINIRCVDGLVKRMKVFLLTSFLCKFWITFFESY